DEALAPNPTVLENLPMARPKDANRARIVAASRQILDFTKQLAEFKSVTFDWLRVEHDIEKPSLKLQSPAALDSDAFVAEVKRIRGKKKPLSAAALASLREAYTRTIEPAHALAAESLVLERQLSDLVNEAYGLTPEEVALMWDTAPPRMPIPRPA
ncbi:MAG: hypothetical protein WEH44_08840, partial [Pirellulaceae bacterium]